MLVFRKLFRTAAYGQLDVCVAASRIVKRTFSDRGDGSLNRNNKSAAAQLAKNVDCETKLESPEPKQRKVELEHVRSRINELDQRELRHKEYAEMLKQLIVKPTSFKMERLPFKQPAVSTNIRQSLRNCSSADEVLKLTDNPEQLANELVKLARELNTEKRKNDVVLESYLELKQEMIRAKGQDN